MITRSQIKLIKSLQIKKFRQKEGLFIVEGAKSLQELLLSDFNIKKLYLTHQFINQYEKSLKRFQSIIETVTEKELEEAGSFTSNNAGIAMVEIKPNSPFGFGEREYILALDSVNDPGNLGTIIRVADWYGISKIVCSENTVDFYNSKVITATMGSFTRVRLFYTSLPDFIKKARVKVIGAELEGKNIYQFSFPDSGLIVLGSEANGLTPDVKKLITDHISIPRYGNAESLNVGVAAAVFCDNLRRFQGLS
jgi:RNA methyltransferase, TrmH family